MVDVTKKNSSFPNEVNSDNEQQDSSTLSDGEDTAADLFDSYMEIAKTAELQNASDTSNDFAVVASDDNCCVADSADSTKSFFSNSSQESSNKRRPTDEQQVKTGEASRSAEEKSSKVLKKEGSSMKSKKKSSANISDRLSRTLDSLDILEQQFMFTQTQTEQCEENKDGEMKVVCNIDNKEEDTFNKPENEKPLRVAPHNEMDKEDVSLMSWNKGEKVDRNHSLEQSQAKQVVDNTSIETEIQSSSVEHQKHYSETEPRQQEGSQLENVYQEKEENHENDEKEPPQDNRSDADYYIRGHLCTLGVSGITPMNWQYRWCTLKRDNCLYFYETSREKVPCGVVVLSNYSISKALEINRKFCFKLSKGGARTYYFCPRNKDEMWQWMITLMDATQRSSEKGATLQICEGNVHNVSIPALSIQDPDCHGYLLKHPDCHCYLMKHGFSLRPWQRQYCVLKNGYLYYYDYMSDTVALGVAKLIGYTMKMGEHHGRRYCFRGIPPSAEERTFIFAAETETDRKRWMSRLESSIQKGNTL